jgi:hypothetical protein
MTSLYDQDFAQRVERQVELLRSGRAAGLDVPNLTLELEGLTKRDERALGSRLKRIMAHLLKQRLQPQCATRSWAARSRTAAGKSPTSLSRAPTCAVPCRA